MYFMLQYGYKSNYWEIKIMSTQNYQHLNEHVYPTLNAARQTLSGMPKVEESKTFMEHIVGTPASRYEKAKNKFLDKLQRVTACLPNYTYKVDFNIPEGADPTHYVVKAKEALNSIQESDPIVVGFIADAIKAADALLKQPLPGKANDVEMEK